MMNKEMDNKMVRIQNAQDQAIAIKTEVDVLDKLICNFIRDNRTQRLMGEVVREGISEELISKTEIIRGDLKHIKDFFIYIEETAKKMLEIIEENEEDI